MRGLTRQVFLNRARFAYKLSFSLPVFNGRLPSSTIDSCWVHELGQYSINRRWWVNYHPSWSWFKLVVIISCNKRCRRTNKKLMITTLTHWTSCDYKKNINFKSHCSGKFCHERKAFIFCCVSLIQLWLEEKCGGKLNLNLFLVDWLFLLISFSPSVDKKIWSTFRYF